MAGLKNIVSLTDAAAARVMELTQRTDAPVLGLRVGVKKGGCSGMEYVVDYAHDRNPLEEMVEDKGVKIFIDPMAIMFLLGCEMDYEETRIRSGFTFNNPNETARCGCGESFSI